MWLPSIQAYTLLVRAICLCYHAKADSSSNDPPYPIPGHEVAVLAPKPGLSPLVERQEEPYRAGLYLTMGAARRPKV